MKKKLCASALLLAILLSIGATGIQIIWYTQSPHAGSLADSDVWSLQRTVPNRYYYATLSQLKGYVSAGLHSGTNGVSITNAPTIFVTNIYSISNYFDYVTITNGLTNLYLTPNTLLEADANKAIVSLANGTGFLTNNGAGAFNWMPFASLTDFFTNTFANLTNVFILNSNNVATGTSNTFNGTIYVNGPGGPSTFLEDLIIGGGLTGTNAFTNITLTASSLVRSDANKAMVSLLNGLGLLTNDSSGGFGWMPLDQLTNFNTLTVLSNAYFFQTNVVNTTIVTNLFVISNAYFFATNTFDTIIVSNTATVNQIDYYTNLSTMAPDFNKGYAAITTNAGFAFLLPINLDATQKKVQTAVVRVDNSTGPTPIAVTLPANVHSVPGSVFWITNSTYFTWSYYSPDQTNCYAVPIY